MKRKKKDQWIIYIPVKQKIKLKDIVGPIYMKVCYIKYNNMFYNLNNLIYNSSIFLKYMNLKIINNISNINITINI